MCPNVLPSLRIATNSWSVRMYPYRVPCTFM
jgi:hypothetical protein